MTKDYLIRRYVAADIPAIVALGTAMVEKQRQGQDNHFKGIEIEPEKVYKTLQANERNIRFFTNLVIDKDGKIVGILSAMVQEYYFSSECVAADQLFYFDADYVNLAAIKDLIKSYVDWASRRNVREVQLRSSTGFKQDKFALLMKRYGFKQFEIGFSKEF